jgi:hypothetical protein
MYISARLCQERASAKNRLYAMSKEGTKQATRPIYEVDDHVLYWEPAQKHRMQIQAELDAGDDRTTRPSKWTDKWTGPHRIKSIDGGNNYTIFHHDKAKNIVAHANKLSPYYPWSEGVTSTSRAMDHKNTYRLGEWVMPGSTVVLPLAAPIAFGVASMLSCNDDGDMILQWLGNPAENPHGTFLKGWQTPNGNHYFADTPRNLRDEPLLTKIDFNQRDVIIHNFDFTPTGKLTQPVLRAISEHPDIWWELGRPTTTTKPPNPAPQTPTTSMGADTSMTGRFPRTRTKPNKEIG